MLLRTIFISYLMYSFCVISFAQEQLIIFTNAKQPVLQHTDIPPIQTLANEMGIEVLLHNVNKGHPAEVVYTPLIVFQNPVGRSTYYGRYKNIPRLKNFIRTARLAHQEEAQNLKDQSLVWDNQAASIVAPLKITEIAGDTPKNFDAAQFQQMALEAFAEGMSMFDLKKDFNVTRGSRSFYVNLYPYFEKNKLSLTAEIFSQYNCVDPVYTRFDPVLFCKKWSSKEAVFKKAGTLIQEEIIQLMHNSAIGDAFAPIPNSISKKTWAELDMALPKAVKPVATGASMITEIPKKWQVEQLEGNKDPILIFKFLPPLDNYIGEVKQLSGTLELADSNSLEGARGFFEVSIADVTMGDAGFDHEVQNKMLKKDLFPKASFTFEQVLESTELRPYELQSFLVHGTFEMMGKAIQLDIPAKIELLQNSDAETRLRVQLSFQLPLSETFGVAGPEGPSPAKDILQFYLKFDLKPY